MWCRCGSPSGYRPHQRNTLLHRTFWLRRGWLGTPRPSSVAPSRDPAGRRDAEDAAATSPSYAAAGRRWPRSASPRTRGGSTAAPSPGSTTRTRTTTAADRHPRSARTTARSGSPPASADDPQSPWLSTHLDHPHAPWPTSRTPCSCGTPSSPPPVPGARPRRPAPPPASAAPRGSCDPASGRRCHAHRNSAPHSARKYEYRPTCLDLLSISLVSDVADQLSRGRVGGEVAAHEVGQVT